VLVARQVSRLKAEIAAVSNQLKDNRTSQLETRLATLADSLVEKQGTIDQLISEKVCLELLCVSHTSG
jgi:major membrane immunogen (membrane-anchored lipoprotein)